MAGFRRFGMDREVGCVDGVLVAAHERSELEGGKIVIHGPQPGQMRLFQLMGLVDYIHLDGDTRPRSDNGNP